MSVFYKRLEELCRKEGTAPQSKEIAEEIGVSTATITSWKRSGSLPKAPVLLKIAKHFHVSIEYLLGVDDIGSMSDTEKVLIRKFRESDIEEQLDYISWFIEKDKQNKENRAWFDQMMNELNS